MRWQTLQLICAAQELEAAEDAILEAVATLPDASVFLGSRVEAGPGEGEHRLMITLKDAVSRDRLQFVLDERTRLAGYLLQAVEEEDRDWVAEVAATEVAVPLGSRFAALPGAATPLPGRRGIRVPRSRAFGTGEHPSTRLAAALLEDVVGPGRGLLDLGTGTGILAVLGRHLGADPVVAVEKDPVACAIAAETFKENGAGDILTLVGTVEALDPAACFSVIVANIERDVLLSAMPDLLSHLEPGGHLVLSGLLTGQVDDVAAEADRWGGVELQRRVEAEWGALDLTRRPGRLPRMLITGSQPGPDAAVILPETEARHLVKVRRTPEGAAVEVTDGAGKTWFGRLQRRGKDWAVADCRAMTPATEPAFPLTVLPAVLHESGRMEALLRQCVELGVTRIQPVLTARCQGARRSDGKGQRRWQRTVEEAVKQCGRVSVPTLAATGTLDQVRLAEGEMGIFMDPAGRHLTALLLAPAPAAAALLVGPEGGFTAGERAMLISGGWHAARLGPRILRTGTAAAAAAGLVLSAWGDLGESGDS